MEIKQKKRSEISNEFKWNLTEIFLTKEDWQKAIDSMSIKTKEIEAFKGKLKDGASILDCFEKLYTASKLIGKIYVYANMTMHEDANVSEAQGMASLAESEYTKFNAAVSFVDPEILENDYEVVKGFVKNTAGLDAYAHVLDNLFRTKAHTLSAEVEEILANANEISKAPSKINEMLDSADMKFGEIKDEDGNSVELTPGRYGSYIRSKDRRVRKDVFDAYHEGYAKLKNTFTTMYSQSIKSDMFFAKTRKYESSRAASLSNYNIPVSVYDNLIEAVHEFLPVMHRYVAVRKKALNLDKVHMYDMFCPMIEEADTNVSYEEAKKKLAEGLAPLGKEYIDAMSKGMESSWIDVYENEGKMTGAYSWGVQGTPPYVLMNYDNKIGDMFTLAHEMGHSMHSYYSWGTQPKQYGSYSLFLAEVASTVNEALLMEHMLKTTDDPKVRLFLIGEYIDQFRGTVFRQTMFAEFEHIMHEQLEKGEPMTLEGACKTYRELVEKYHGPDFHADEFLDIEWMRISHFYRAFYVYQYSTGYSSAIAFAKRIKEEGEPAVKDYLDFLKAGSSDYSINILKKAGVDMSTPEPVREALKVFDELVTMLEKEYE